MIQTLLIFLAFFSASHHTSEIQAPGRLTGQILDAVTRAALPGVRVSLAPLESGDTRAARAAAPNTITDAEGRFAFERVAPAAYRVSAERSPSVFDPDAARSLEITAGAAHEVELLIARAGRITGMVTSPAGEPLRALRVSAIAVAQPVAPTVRAGGTNENGEFDLFDLPPGDYVVMAAPSVMSLRPAQSDAAPSWGATYYPGTLDRTAARSLIVHPETTVAAIDFTMMTVKTFTVTGIVVDARGEPYPFAMIGLFPGTAADASPAALTVSQADGSFRIDAVPGTYRLVAVISQMPADGTRPAPMSMQSGMSITIEDRNLSDLRIVAVVSR